MPNTPKEIQEAANDVVNAWESLKGNQEYSAKMIQDWLENKMKPAMDKLRISLGRKIPS